MREHQQISSAQVRGYLVRIELRLRLVGSQNHHHVGPLGDFGDGAYFEAGLLRLGNRFGAGGKAHFHFNAGVLEVERVGMALRAIADDGHLLGLDERKVCIVIVVSLCHWVSDSSFGVRSLKFRRV